MAGFFFADWSTFEAPPAEILIQRKMDSGKGTARDFARRDSRFCRRLDRFEHDCAVRGDVAVRPGYRLQKRPSVWLAARRRQRAKGFAAYL